MAVTNPSDQTLSNQLSDPFHLHSNENPALVLVSPVLNGDNYHSWSRSMVIALKSKNKLQFVDGTLTAPSSGDAQFPSWERCNTMVLSWIMHSIDNSIAQSLIWMDTAADVWADLRERFGRGDAIRICDLQEEIYNLRQGALSVNDYFTNFKTLWDQLIQFRSLLECKCTSLLGANSHNCIVHTTVKNYRDNDQTIRFLRD